MSISRLLKDIQPSTPFVAPEALERQRDARFGARLGANENNFGPSPKVLEALFGAQDALNWYPDPEAYELRKDLAEAFDLSMENILVGEGIDGLFGLVTRVFLDPGDIAVSTAGGYPTFDYQVRAMGGKMAHWPMTDHREDLEGLLTLAQQKDAKMIYVSNPNNPMGSVNQKADIEAMIDNLPSDTLLVLDEAYRELAPKDVNPTPDPRRENVLHFRTFSKAYGLAGLRIGYMIGASKIMAEFDKIRNHFGVSRVAQIAARAALADQPYLDEVIKKNDQGRRRIASIAAENGLRALPSATNFVAIDCGTRAHADAILAALAGDGVFLRKPRIAPQDRMIRVSVGQERELDLFEISLKKTLARLS